MTKTESLLALIPLLTNNTQYTKEDLADRLGTTVRSINRYITELEEAGFDIEKERRIYSISLHSPFIRSVSKHLRFTGSNLSTLVALIREADSSNAAIRNLRVQFNNIYGDTLFEGVKIDKEYNRNLDTIYQAIKHRRKAILHGYYSPNSQSKKDRLVEPFRFIMNDNSIRCYEIESGMCKTFKMARITEGITLLDEEWEHHAKHTSYFTDIFGFSGERTYRITLRLGILAARILCEEHGVSMKEMTQEDDTHWIYATNVCSYQGIGRFVMGLISDIDIIHGEGLKTFLSENLKVLTEKLDSSHKIL